MVSVLITTYNSAKFLRRCLDALLAQTHQALEVIVVDDASEDETRVVLEQFTRVRVLYSLPTLDSLRRRTRLSVPARENGFYR